MAAAIFSVDLLRMLARVVAAILPLAGVITRFYWEPSRLPPRAALCIATTLELALAVFLDVVYS